MGSKDHMQKISRIGIVVFPQLSFFSFEKSEDYESHQGIIVRLSMEETLIRQNKVRTTYLVILKF